MAELTRFGSHEMQVRETASLRARTALFEDGLWRVVLLSKVLPDLVSPDAWSTEAEAALAIAPFVALLEAQIRGA